MRLVFLPLLGLLATAADAPPLKALASLQPGRWTLTSRDAGFPVRSICLTDARVLLQIRHPDSQCRHFVIADDATNAVVQYSCPGIGYGRTSVRVETPRLAQVETQGVAGKSPFDLSIEARRTGECGALSMR